jgi:hypothetical protein
MVSDKPEFLSELSRNCVSRMFAWFDVASRREPELRTFVIYEKDFATVDNREV